MNDTPVKFPAIFNGLAVRGNVGQTHQNIFTDKPGSPRFIPTRFLILSQRRKFGCISWILILHVRGRQMLSPSSPWII